MVPVTVLVEEAVIVTIAMVPELELAEEAVEQEMTSEMVKEVSIVTPVATTAAGVVVLTSNTTVKIVNKKRKATTHQPPTPSALIHEIMEAVGITSSHLVGDGG